MWWLLGLCNLRIFTFYIFLSLWSTDSCHFADSTPIPHLLLVLYFVILCSSLFFSHPLFCFLSLGLCFGPFLLLPPFTFQTPFVGQLLENWRHQALPLTSTYLLEAKTTNRSVFTERQCLWNTAPSLVNLPTFSLNCLILRQPQRAWDEGVVKLLIT